jgi:hypothetical protein
MPASRSAVAACRGAVRSFSTPSRPALRAASGRPPARQPHDANRGCRLHAGQGGTNRSSGRESEGLTPAAVHRSSLSGIRFWRVLPRFARRPSGRDPCHQLARML